MFNFGTTLELVLFILGLVFTTFSLGGIFLTFKSRGGKAFTLIALLIIPVLALTLLFSLIFVSTQSFKGLIAVEIVVAFAISVALEFLAFIIARIFSKRKEA